MKILKIKRISLVIIVLFLLLFSNKVLALEVTNSINENDSMYQYNALENKNFFPSLAVADTINSVVKELPKGGELPDDITTKLQNINEKQDFSIIQINNAIDTLKNRSGVKTFLVGNSLGILKFQLVQIKDLISTLNALNKKTEDITIKVKINNQTELLKEEQAKVENFILEQKDRFSLLGWLVTSF